MPKNSGPTSIHQPIAMLPHRRNDLPTWVAHPLKVPSSQPTMLLFPGDMTHYAGMLAACRQLPAVQESWMIWVVFVKAKGLYQSKSFL